MNACGRGRRLGQKRRKWRTRRASVPACSKIQRQNCTSEDACATRSMNLINGFVNNPVKVTVGVILVLLFGVLAAARMPMQLTPEVEIPTLTIETQWPGASPQEVEQEIVQEQEEQLKSVEGVRKISSESMDSMGRVTLEFPVGANMQEALIKVNTKLAQVPSYPEDAREPVINTSNASDRPIAWFILSQRVPSVEEAAKLAAQHPN